MGVRARVVVAGTVLVLLAGSAGATGAPRTPQETVRQYLTALKDSDFGVAYDLVSKAMKQDKGREVWVKEQQAGMAFADVKIFDIDVRPGKVEGDTAYVPNILQSQDRFVNQLGLTEYELYTLLREDGVWKVDRQVVLEPANILKWFPEAAKDAPAATGRSD